MFGPLHFCLFSTIAIELVVSSSSSFNSSLQTGGRQHSRRDSYHHDSDFCANDEWHRLQMWDSLESCLRECKMSVIVDDGYLDTDDAGATAGDGGSADAREWALPSWTKISIVTPSWYLAFASLELHQLLLMMVFLFAAECHEDFGLVLGFIIGLLAYLISQATYGSSSDPEDDIDYHEHEVYMAISVPVGRKAFTCAVTGPRF